MGFSSNSTATANLTLDSYPVASDFARIPEMPQHFTIILANGDVYPCSIVEYTNEPIMGNIFKNNFKEIWMSEKWNDFRHNLHGKCHLCPMNIHISVPLKP